MSEGGDINERLEVLADDPELGQFIKIARDSDSLDFRIEQVEVQENRTISAEALAEVETAITRFIMARIMVDWGKRLEPPSQVTISVTVQGR